MLLVHKGTRQRCGRIRFISVLIPIRPEILTEISHCIQSIESRNQMLRKLKLTFTAPYLLDDLELLSRPVNYISYQAKALDGKEHDVAIYFEMDPHKAFRAGQSA